MDIATAKLIAALLVLPLVLGTFVYIDVWVMSSTDWDQAFKDRLLDVRLMFYYALIAPAGIYWAQKIILDNSKGRVWAVNIVVAVLMQIGGICATYLASKTFPSSKEIIALFIIALAMLWSRT
jgi:hypothetical protein